MKRIILGEAMDILKIMPLEQLVMFNHIRKNDAMWESFKGFAQTQKQIKLDKIYRLRRPRSQDDVIKNSVEHEYYTARIASLVVLLQIMENAGSELEKREGKARRKK